MHTLFSNRCSMNSIVHNQIAHVLCGARHLNIGPPPPKCWVVISLWRDLSSCNNISLCLTVSFHFYKISRRKHRVTLVGLVIYSPHLRLVDSFCSLPPWHYQWFALSLSVQTSHRLFPHTYINYMISHSRCYNPTRIPQSSGIFTCLPIPSSVAWLSPSF
jgi:hypothetical protein